VLPQEGGASQDDEGEHTPYAIKLRSLEKRVAAMGGIPALGSVVLPRMTPGQRSGLQATASPAAVEMLRGRVGSEVDAATPLRKTGAQRGESAAAAPSPLVLLRKVAEQPGSREGGGGSAAAASSGEAPFGSELAKALQRRAPADEPPAAAGGE
jgi:hypothetical protein